MSRIFKMTTAEREKLKFSAMFMGATGSGKTVGALITAKGLVKAKHPELDDTSADFWKLIGILDTEHNRSKVYANTSLGGDYIGNFLHVEFEPPYDVQSYLDGVEYLKGAGCEVIIIDSITHAWDDAGGILDLHANMGGQFATWQKINPIIKKLYLALTADQDVHIITTVRSKIKYEAAASETGKMKVSKIGLKPIMRDDFEYEVLTALHFDEDHKVSVIKDNTHIFENEVVMNSGYGVSLHDYLEKGIDVSSQRKDKLVSIVKAISNMLDLNKDNKELTSLMNLIDQQSKRKYGVVSWKDLPLNSLENVLVKIKEVLNLNGN
jgi:hypothetical protein